MTCKLRQGFPYALLWVGEAPRPWAPTSKDRLWTRWTCYPHNRILTRVFTRKGCATCTLKCGTHGLCIETVHATQGRDPHSTDAGDTCDSWIDTEAMDLPAAKSQHSPGGRQQVLPGSLMGLTTKKLKCKTRRKSATKLSEECHVLSSQQTMDLRFRGG